MTDKTEVSYTPNGPVYKNKEGLFLTTRLMWSELIASRDLVFRLFIRDFSAKYRQSALGIIWALIMPLITVGMFVGMNKSGILKIEDVGIPYPLYAIIGLTIWNFFTVGLTACANSIIGAGQMIAKINFSKVALILAASGQGIVEFFIRTLLIGAVFIFFGMIPSLKGLFIGLACLFPLYLLSTSA